MNHIITFANQKGGVGKSTLAILFANYLCWKKMNVCIIDTDLQQTIAQMRKSDLDFYACEAPYSVQGFPVSDVDTMRQLMENARKFDGCVLIDAPGNLSQDGLIPILSETDFIVCPYRYDKATTASTSIFVKTILRMMREIRGMKPQLLFTPNNIYRKGNMEEKKVWKQFADTFEMVGTVLPTVPTRADLERIDTIEVTPSQRDVVQDTFEYIIKIILDSEL